MIQCEVCQGNISSPLAAHSMLIHLQKVTPDGYTYGQCQLGTEVNYHKGQHWYCSEHEMVGELPTCINTHHTEDMLHGIEPGAGKTILHTIVLEKNQLACKVCAAALTTQAYRICLQIALPYNAIPDNQSDELQGWCCSLEHAKQSALATLASIQQ